MSKTDESKISVYGYYFKIWRITKETVERIEMIASGVKELLLLCNKPLRYNLISLYACII